MNEALKSKRGVSGDGARRMCLGEARGLASSC
jgi:hypothetical protein